MKTAHILAVVLVAGVAGVAGAQQSSTPASSGGTAPAGGTGGTVNPGNPGAAVPGGTGQGAFLPPQPTLPAQPGANRPSAFEQQGGVNDGSPTTFGWGNLANQTFTNQFGGSFTIGDLMTRLAELQRDVQVTLPLLSAVNNSSDIFTALNTSSSTKHPTLPYQQARALAARNLGTNLASNLGANLARSPVSARGNVLTPTGTSNGLRPGFNAAAPGASNVFWMTDQSKALVVLQSDMERMLPILSAFNEGTAVGIGATGGLTNAFGVGNAGASGVGGAVAPGTGVSRGSGTSIPSPRPLPGTQPR